MQRCETFHGRYIYGKRSHFYGKWSANSLVTLLGPGRTSVKSCLFYKKICQQVGFTRATDLSDIVKMSGMYQMFKDAGT